MFDIKDWNKVRQRHSVFNFKLWQAMAALGANSSAIFMKWWVWWALAHIQVCGFSTTQLVVTCILWRWMSKAVFLCSLPQSVSGFRWRFGGFSVMVITQKDNSILYEKNLNILKKKKCGARYCLLQFCSCHDKKQAILLFKCREQGTMLGLTG